MVGPYAFLIEGPCFDSQYHLNPQATPEVTPIPVKHNIVQNRKIKQL